MEEKTEKEVVTRRGKAVRNNSFRPLKRGRGKTRNTSIARKSCSFRGKSLPKSAGTVQEFRGRGGGGGDDSSTCAGRPEREKKLLESLAHDVKLDRERGTPIDN